MLGEGLAVAIQCTLSFYSYSNEIPLSPAAAASTSSSVLSTAAADPTTAAAAARRTETAAVAATGLHEWHCDATRRIDHTGLRALHFFSIIWHLGDSRFH